MAIDEETTRPPMVKCLVWDLDDTLWQGILLEDSTTSLTDDVRQVVGELDRRGILQAVASKNDHDLAWDRLTELGMAEYFVLARIGWGPKSKAVRDIADTLGFATAAVAFIDDQPAERAEVAFSLPDVRCYPATAADTLPRLPEFTPDTITPESARRRHMYQAGVQRTAERDRFTGPDEEFLVSLGMELRIEHATRASVARVEELTLRTSQMNATGVHYSEDDLLALLPDPEHAVLTASLTDRFGEHGAVGALLVRRQRESWNLKMLTTSCRVVSFGVGSVLLNWLSDRAARAGVHMLADFRRTERNRIMEVAYRFAGFDDVACPCRTAAAQVGDLTRLHLTPARHQKPTTMRLVAPDVFPTH